MLTAYGLSHVGLVRKTNEDGYLCDMELGLFSVADGMGGHNAGEVASKLALDCVRGFLLVAGNGQDVSWPFGIDTRLSFDANRLLTSVKLANRRVFRQADERDEYTGMGTTIVAALIDGTRCVYVGVGDSRLYSFREGRLTQLTRDDSWIAAVMARGEPLDAASLATHPMRHVLTSVIGGCEELQVEAAERKLSLDETLLFCTDGLHGPVADSVIANVLGAQSSLESAAARLVQEALERGGPDNITVLLVHRDSH